MLVSVVVPHARDWRRAEEALDRCASWPDPSKLKRRDYVLRRVGASTQSTCPQVSHVKMVWPDSPPKDAMLVLRRVGSAHREHLGVTAGVGLSGACCFLSISRSD